LTDPLLGLGPDTFGERYEEPTCDCPAHIPNQLSATFYETGLIGLVSLLALLGLVLLRAWQVRLTAYVAALIVLVVGYQFTDAIRFASLWILVGAAIGLIIVTTGRVAGPFSRPPADRR
jgi:O-antigen ligase